MRKSPSNINKRFWPILLLAFLPFLEAAPLKNLPEIPLKNEKGEFVQPSSLKKEKEVLILLFVSSTCPITSLYWERIKGMWYNYRDQDCKIILIGGNSDDTMSHLMETLKSKDLEIPVFWDVDHKLAHYLSIDHTPMAVIVGRNQEILYRGRIDDCWRDEQRVKVRYLETAIMEALQNRVSADHLDDLFLGSRMR